MFSIKLKWVQIYFIYVITFVCIYTMPKQGLLFKGVM